MKPVRRLFGFGPGTEPLLLMGLLGGYPVGAGIIGEAVRQGKLDKDAAARLLPCCNIPGPSFIFGILGPCFSSPRIPWAIWGLTILSAAVCARTFRAGGKISLLSGNRGPDFSEVMKSSVRSVLLVCGWVILFRGGLRCLFSALPESCPPLLRVLLYGSLEMSNGCLLLPEVKTEGIRMAAAAGLVSFGGLCVFLQIRSAAPGLSMRYYIWGKLLESILSALAALLIFCLMMPESIGNFQDWQMVFRLFPK